MRRTAQRAGVLGHLDDEGVRKAIRLFKKDAPRFRLFFRRPYLPHKLTGTLKWVQDRIDKVAR